VLNGTGQPINWVGSHPPLPTSESPAVIAGCKTEQANARAAAQKAFLQPCLDNPCTAVLSICEQFILNGNERNGSVKYCFTEAVYKQTNTNFQAIGKNVEALCLKDIQKGRFDNQGVLDILSAGQNFTCALPQYDLQFPGN
jgi:hypothetical protein